MSGIDRVAFRLSGFPVYWYGLLIAAGMLMGVLLASAREKRYGMKRDTALNFVLLAIPIALICARIYYVAFSWEQYAGNPAEIFNVRNGGMAIYGGVIGGVITGWIYSRLTKTSLGTLADLCAPALALGQAVGRWGNFFNQEAYGERILNEALHFFPAGVFIDAQGAWHYATFFYESVWCCVIVLILLTCEQRKAFKRSGDVFLWYALLYSAERMVVEGMRTDSLYWGSLRISQLISAAALAVLILIFLLRALRNGNKPVLCAVLYLFLILAVPVNLSLFPVGVQAIHAMLLLGVGVHLYRHT